MRARKSHNADLATNICAHVVARWNSHCNGLLIGLSLNPGQRQQCQGSTSCPHWHAPQLSSHAFVDHLVTSWDCSGSPLGSTRSPYLHCVLHPRSLLGREMTAWAAHRAHFFPQGCPQRPLLAGYKEKVHPPLPYCAPQIQMSFCWCPMVRELHPVPGSPLLPGCTLGCVGFVSRFFKYFALWFFMLCSKCFAKGTL